MWRAGDDTNMETANISPFAGLDIVSLLTRRAAERPDHPVLIWASGEGPEKTWTYASFVHEVACLAGGLSARAIRPGDRVLLHVENCPEARSEENTSELPSLMRNSYDVFCLKKKQRHTHTQ